MDSTITVNGKNVPIRMVDMEEKNKINERLRTELYIRGQLALSDIVEILGYIPICIEDDE